MKSLGKNVMAAALLPVAVCSADPRPNILVVMTDDQGVGDIGFNGNEWVHTPVLDRLASESARFTNFIAAPACTPSRASFLTGRNHLRTGVWGVGPRGYINRDEIYLPEYLRRAGYATAHFGKWGEGWAPDGRTYMRGYEEAGALGSGYQQKDPRIDFNDEIRQVKGWTSDILADLTIDFIERQTDAGKPWYAITAYITPHSPWMCDPDYSDPLEAKGYSKPMAILCGMIEQMDAATGRIFQTLEKLGQVENTIVIYVSDNGPTPVCKDSVGTPMDGEDWKKRNVLDLTGRKSWVWENGIRVPCCIRWPGRIVPGKRTQFGAYEDLLPTILDLAGVPDSIVPEHLPFDGQSLKPVLMNADAEDTERYFFRVAIADAGTPRQGDSGIITDPKAIDYEAVHTSLRGPKYKFHHLPGGKPALYDVVNDPGETTDISASLPEKTKALAAACRKEWDQIVNSDRRSFTMPSFLIGDPRYEHLTRGWGQMPPDTIGGNAPVAVSGAVTVPFSGAAGFAGDGDSATYAIDVRTAGSYTLSVAGEKLDQCAPLVLRVDGRVFKPLSNDGKKMQFGTADLPAKKMNVVLLAGTPGPNAVSARIKEIQILPGE